MGWFRGKDDDYNKQLLREAAQERHAHVEAKQGSAGPSDWQGEVAGLIRSGNAIAAIKVYRENTGLGLAEAKAAVDAIRDDMSRRGVIR